MTVPYRKKLIEVALPLPEINDASAYDKMPGIGASEGNSSMVGTAPVAYGTRHPVRIRS